MLNKMKFITNTLIICFFSLIAEPNILNASCISQENDIYEEITLSNGKLKLKFLASELGFGLSGIINKKYRL